MAKIFVITEGLANLSHELGDQWISIGRGDDNIFQVEESTVSNWHCEVLLTGEELQVRDLESTNGTFINDERIVEAAMRPDQILRLGEVELRFELSPLDAPPADAGQPVPLEAALPAAKTFKVLFVDDSRAFLETFAELFHVLSEDTWQIDCATTVDRALAALQEKSFDLAVVDVGMPMVDGLQLVAIIRRRYPGMKIAVMTGDASESKRETALASGADLFIQKPVTPEGITSVFNLLNDLLTWSPPEPQETGEARGARETEDSGVAVPGPGLSKIIQQECVGGHSLILEVAASDVKGEIYIENGEIIHAVIGSIEGVAAFQQLYFLKKAAFKEQPFAAPAQRTIDDRWEFLLMDASNAMIEASEASEKSAPLPAAASKTATPEKPADSGSPDPEFVVVATYDGKWNPADDEKK